jgi:DNA-binding response OmpR family regulator
MDSRLPVQEKAMYKVLVMGEKSEIGEALVNDLGRSEYNVTSVPDTPEAAKDLNKSVPDIVILNEQSKTTDSWEVCKELNESLGIPVIILGKDTSENAWIKTVQVGGDLYLRKPFGRGELAARVKAILRRYKSKA